MKYRWWEQYVGWRSPQLKIQITPFCWGYGWGWSSERVSIRVGPIAFALWFRISDCEVHWSSTNEHDSYYLRDRHDRRARNDSTR